MRPDLTVPRSHGGLLGAECTEALLACPSYKDVTVEKAGPAL